MGLCDLCFHASSQPCLHTFGMPSLQLFTFLIFLFSCFRPFLIIISVTARPIRFPVWESGWLYIGFHLAYYLITWQLPAQKLYPQTSIKTDHPSSTKAMSSVAKSKQLNAAPFLRVVNEPFHYHGKRPYKPCLLVNVRFCVCTNLVPRPITVVFGLGMRPHLCMYTKLENGVLCNR